MKRPSTSSRVVVSRSRSPAMADVRTISLCEEMMRASETACAAHRLGARSAAVSLPRFLATTGCRHHDEVSIVAGLTKCLRGALALVTRRNLLSTSATHSEDPLLKDVDDRCPSQRNVISKERPFGEELHLPERAWRMLDQSGRRSNRERREEGVMREIPISSPRRPPSPPSIRKGPAARARSWHAGAPWTWRCRAGALRLPL
jgi:hypothetical protein